LVKEHAKETSLYLSMVRFERLISLLMVAARLKGRLCGRRFGKSCPLREAFLNFQTALTHTHTHSWPWPARLASPISSPLPRTQRFDIVITWSPISSFKDGA
jgi:hypothetical protein